MEKFLKQYQVLLKKAKVDFNSAIYLLEGFESGKIELDIEVIMFHLQQSTEKLLKSLLAYNKLHFTKTHDLEKLFIEIKNNDIKILDEVECLLPLSDYAVEGRYSIISDDVEDINRYIIILKKVIKFVESEIE